MDANDDGLVPEGFEHALQIGVQDVQVNEKLGRIQSIQSLANGGNHREVPRE
jgi:hypothetical protein